jgi:hypothetical protein
MEPETVSIELPAQLYADLQSLAAAERTAPVEVIAQIVELLKSGREIEAELTHELARELIIETVKVAREQQVQVNQDKLESLRREVHARKNLLLQIIQTFESRYECSLEELERKLESREIDEHPAWEDSIEWRNAVEQFDRIQLSESIFTWLQTLLTQSAAS